MLPEQQTTPKFFVRKKFVENLSPKFFSSEFFRPDFFLASVRRHERTDERTNERKSCPVIPPSKFCLRIQNRNGHIARKCAAWQPSPLSKGIPTFVAYLATRLDVRTSRRVARYATNVGIPLESGEGCQAAHLRAIWPFLFCIRKQNFEGGITGQLFRSFVRSSVRSCRRTDAKKKSGRKNSDEKNFGDKFSTNFFRTKNFGVVCCSGSTTPKKKND